MFMASKSSASDAANWALSSCPPIIAERWATHRALATSSSIVVSDFFVLPNCLLLTRQLAPTPLDWMRVVWKRTNSQLLNPVSETRPPSVQGFF
jgi:hypothetical protein